MTQISKRFGPVQALSDVSFTVRAGTVHALVGENGAGKSTLMKILSGVYQPDSGSIEIHGQSCTFDKPEQALSAGVSMIYQELDLAELVELVELFDFGKWCAVDNLDLLAIQDTVLSFAADTVSYNFHSG